MSLTSIRSVLTPTAVFQVLLGWVAFITVSFARPFLEGSLSSTAVFTLLIAMIGIIIICAFGVVTHAEHLAVRLGDPYGTLVLTLSIVVIEVMLISAVMLGPGEQQTIARDSVMAVSMIILNLTIGIGLVIGGSKYKILEPNRAGISSYMSLLIVLLAVAFALPGVVGIDGTYSPAQAVLVLVMTILLYVFFLYRQMGTQRQDFQEVTTITSAQDHPPAPRSMNGVLAKHRPELLTRTVLLVLTVLPIVLLSHDMAILLDDGLERTGAPKALSGILIAAIVFLPETITAIRAATLGEIQRVSNLCHGALVSTIGLTIPAVLIIGLLTDQKVVLAESPANLLLLGISVLLSVTSFLGKRITALHGGAHLMTFMLYLLVVFS